MCMVVLLSIFRESNWGTVCLTFQGISHTLQLFNVEIHFLEVNTQTLLDHLDISLFASHEKIDKCGVICWNITWYMVSTVTQAEAYCMCHGIKKGAVCVWRFWVRVLGGNLSLDAFGVVVLYSVGKRVYKNLLSLPRIFYDTSTHNVLTQ